MSNLSKLSDKIGVKKIIVERINEVHFANGIVAYSNYISLASIFTIGSDANTGDTISEPTGVINIIIELNSGKTITMNNIKAKDTMNEDYLFNVILDKYKSIQNDEND